MNKIPEKDTPCRYCEIRKLNCHASSEEYKAYKKKLDKERNERYKAYNDDRYFADKNFAKAKYNIRYRSRLKKRGHK